MSRPEISDLEKQLSDQSNRLLSLQEMVDDLASKVHFQPFGSNVSTHNFSLSGTYTFSVKIK